MRIFGNDWETKETKGTTKRQTRRPENSGNYPIIPLPEVRHSAATVRMENTGPSGAEAVAGAADGLEVGGGGAEFAADLHDVLVEGAARGVVVFAPHGVE